MNAVLGKHITAVMASYPNVAELIRNNKLRALAVASASRIASMPDVPTLAESGIRDAEAIVWFGMSGPPRLPRDIVNKLNVQVNRILAMADVKQRLDSLGLEVAGGKPEDFDAFVKKEAAKVTGLIKAGLLKVE